MVELLTIPHRGIGPFVLGSSRDSIALAVGNPDYVEITKDSCSAPQEEWHYDRLSITLTFSEEYDWRLCSIAAFGSHAVLNGVRFIGQHTTDLDTLCRFARISDLQPDGDYGEYGGSYYSASLGLMLWIEAGHVVKLHLFPKYDATGNQPCWPAIDDVPA